MTDHRTPFESPVPPATGTLPWALGFIAYIGFPPFVIAVVAGLCMAGPLRSQRRRGALAAENARHAANWGFTYALLTVVFIGGALLIVAIATGFQGGTIPPHIEVVVFTLIGIGFLGLGIAQAVAAIGGTVVSSRGRVFRMPIAIPFLRARPGEVEAAAAESARAVALREQARSMPPQPVPAFVPAPSPPTRADVLEAEAAALEAELDAAEHDAPRTTGPSTDPA